MALVELVKNAYDADACTATVRLRHIQDPATTTIEMVDDGDGMSLDTVLNAWMEPAASAKRQGHGRGRRRTALGRLPLGEKGVGRFAADKLGGEMELVTRARHATEEVVLRVEWHAFEGDAYLEDVHNCWSVRAPQEFTGHGHGTIIRVHRVRTVWDEALVTRIREGLARLVSPHADQREFTITLDCPEFPQLHGPVVNRLLEGAPHQLQGDVDSEGILHIREHGGSQPLGTVDLRLIAPEHFTGNGVLRVPVCGPFSLALRAWDLDAGGRRPPSTDRATRMALRASSGVSIYRDGFRVMPYGERGEDWLELNQRRVNNPTMRLSNNQVVGMVEITQRDNPDLRDRTSREGLVDTPAFFDFRTLVLAALSILEERRFALRHATAPSVVQTAERDAVLQWVDRARMQAQDGTGVRLALQEIERAYQQKLEEQRSRYEHVVRLAGIGLAAERMTREFARTLDAATVTLRIILNQAGALQGADALREHVQDLHAQYEVLDEQLGLMAPLYRPSARDIEDLDVSGVAHDLTTVLAYRLRESSVRIRITQDDCLTLRINRGHFMQVLLCLFDNALDALEQMGPEHQREIWVHVVTGRQGPGLIVADNGPGVRLDAHRLIFEPFYAARPEKRGLGLHVARDILAGYNSTITLLSDHTLLPGANFVITFDRRRIL
jgi:signal transduction histidine kinase